MSCITKKWFILFLILAMLLGGALGSSGCGERAPAPVQPPAEEEEEREQPEEAEPSRQRVHLYFANVDADKLVPEERELEVDEDEEKIAFYMLEELVKGPQDPDLLRTVPEETRVLGVRIEDGVAYADFSAEIKTRHWGGSTGESLTVYSIANTLAELPQVERVQFLVEGEAIETLKGHLELTEPVDPDWGFVAE